MPNDPDLDVSSGKSPHERFTALGKRLLAVPKAEVDKRDAKWQARKRIKPGRKKR